ncbi:MAG: hypothetical protein R3F14_28305 [Polyangiaceae bacterium]
MLAAWRRRADWPYEKIEVIEPGDAPSWACPDDKCSCNRHEEVSRTSWR